MIRFGFDFDNTLVNYDVAARRWSAENGVPKIESLQDLKSHYRKMGNYEKDWIVVQEWLYTKGIMCSSLNLGASDLITKLRSKNAEIFIVSHKSSKSASKKVDLIQPAQNWIQDKLKDLLDLDANHVFFEESRKKKVKRIELLGLTHFVDDLPEVFQEDTFPKGVKSFWLSLEAKNQTIPNVIAVKTLKSINDYV